MRKLNASLLVLGLVLGLAFLPQLSLAASQKYEVTVDGMTCEDCAKAISMALGKIPNIDQSSVKVSLKAKSASLVMNDANKSTQEQVKKTIEDAGYTVKSIHLVSASGH